MIGTFETLFVDFGADLANTLTALALGAVTSFLKTVGAYQIGERPRFSSEVA